MLAIIFALTFEAVDIGTSFFDMVVHPDHQGQEDENANFATRTSV